MNGHRSNYSIAWLWLLGSVAVAVTVTVALRRYWVPHLSTPSPGYSSGDLLENGTATGGRRSKRFIIFNGSGVVKLVLGVSFPIVLADKKRSLNQFYNLQMQYVPAPRPLYWWSFYNTTTFAARKQRSVDMLLQHDNSRSCFYEFIETIFHSSGNFDNECLLKVICEMARAPLSEDGIQRHHDDYSQIDYGTEHEYPIGDDYGRNIYHKLINAIFTPHLPNVDQRYLNAHTAGSNGANCDELYAKCPTIDELFKRFTRLL